MPSYAPYVLSIARLAMLILVSLVVTGCATRGGSADVESVSPSGNPTTIWDGVYSGEQAQRGEQAAWAHCFSCHLPLDWGNPAFMQSASTWRLGDLFNTISRTMPYDTPGSLSAEQYADIVAYMLQLQEAPAGANELSSSLRELDMIVVPPRDGL